MEAELTYSTLVFDNSAAAPKEKKEDPTIVSEVKPKEAATEPEADGKAAACSHFGVLAACLGILCVLLVASISVIIHFSCVMKEQRANLSNLTAENELLIEERSILNRVTDNLNWTLGMIMKFNTFPVNEYCPDKKCQPCQRDWILFQEKCYLFYSKDYPWKTWKESQEYCQKAAADLVVVDNLHEQEFISNHTKYYYDNFHGYWLGLYKTEDNNWVWVDGRIDTLGYWFKEDFATTGQYALMIPKRNPTASWDPASCEMQNKFICESDVLTRSY